MIDDPLALVVQAVFFLAAGMYPIGFLFGACSKCCEECSFTNCNGFDLEEAYSARSGGGAVCGIELEEGDTEIVLDYNTDTTRIHAGCRVSGTNIPPGTVVVLRDDVDAVSVTLVLSEPATGPVDGCLTFCGTSGLCAQGGILGGFARQPDEGGTFGPYGGCTQSTPPADANKFFLFSPNFTQWERRRSCVRWLCRCYESTGARQEDEEAPAGTWYTVVSSTVVGGPTINNLDLSEELDNATFDGVKLENWIMSQTTFGDYFRNAPAGERGCLVYAFIFYGWSGDGAYVPANPDNPKAHSPADDCYEIQACYRCE